MNETRPPRWYHGGRPGLRKGDFLLPPVTTGTQSVAHRLRDEFGVDPWKVDIGGGILEADRARPDKVFLTRNRDQAMCHAAAWLHSYRGAEGERGACYEAVPDSCWWEPDPDNPVDCIQGYRAKIINVIDPCVNWTVQRWVNHNARYAGRPSPGVESLDANRYRAQERRQRERAR